MNDKKRMYNEARPISSFFVGCNYHCLYCKPSFQRQMKRRKHACVKCYNYEPHAHWERFKQRPSRTIEDEFLFLCDFGDIAFASHEFMLALIGYCYNYPDRTFLIQSKNPACFKKYHFPENVILGTTIETDDDVITSAISKAPKPFFRAKDLIKLNHPRKAVTVEPIMKIRKVNLFPKYNLIYWIKEIKESCKQLIVYVGYDSHPKINQLPEPFLKDTIQLIDELRELDIEVREKLLRKAWWE